MSDSMREAFDAVQADMAKHQHVHGAEVTARANELDAAQILTHVERDAEATKAFAADAQKLDSVESEHTKIRKLPDGSDGYRPNVTLSREEQCLILRMRFLITKPEPGILGRPSWQQRCMEVHAIHLGNAPDKDTRYLRAVRELCDASSAQFGDWRAGVVDEKRILLP